MFQFKCPHCGAVIRIDKKHRGKTGRCKSCGKELLIPAADEEADEFVGACLSDSYNTAESIEARLDKAAVNSRQLARAAPPRPMEEKKKADAGGWAGLIGLLIIAVTIVFYFGRDFARQLPKFQIDASPEMQAEREQMIEKMRQMKIIQKIEIPGTLPHVWVSPAFYALNYDQKSTFISVIAAYHLSQNSSRDPTVLYDSQTGNKVGYFSTATGLNLK